MADVLLIQPPIRDFYLTRQRTVPYGLACIAGALGAAGFRATILDALASPKARELPWPDEMSYLSPHYGRDDRSPFALFHRYRHFGSSFEHLGAAARASGAPLVGISSLFSAYSAEALRTAEAVRAAHPGCRIVLGGHHPSAFPDEVLACEAVDFVVRGEGELGMPLLARALREETSLDSVPGLVWRAGGARRRNPPAQAALDQLPLPAAELLQARGRRRGERAVLVASRGCPLRCSYCSLGAGAKLAYRRRSVDSVLAELEQQVATHGARFVDFEDENLSLDRPWFLRLLAGIRQRFPGAPLELRAMNGLLPHTLDETVVEAMAETGFTSLNLSLGSSSAAQLAAFRRPDERAGFERALELCERHRLSAVGYIVAAAPGQRAAESVEDLLYLAERRVLAGLSIFYPAPGSEDFRRCAEDGTLPRSPSLWRASALPLDQPATSRAQAATLLRLSRLLNFMKALLDRGEALPAPALPAPAPIAPAPIAPAPIAPEALGGSSEKAGRQLLAAFLADGKIRGLSPSGEVFIHETSPELCQQFLRGIERRGGVRGSGQAPRPVR